MPRFPRFLVLALLVASCGSSDMPPPRNLDDACALASERPQYLAALERTEKKWGTPVPVMMAMIHQESKFVSNARTPLQWRLGVIPVGRQSSAYGYSQALDGTWDEYRALQRRPRAKRDDIRDATDFMGWYMDLTAQKLGISKGDARNQYLAYHDGHAGYARGTYRAKGWLMGVADRVADRAVMYDAQLIACRMR